MYFTEIFFLKKYVHILSFAITKSVCNFFVFFFFHRFAKHTYLCIVYRYKYVCIASLGFTLKLSLYMVAIMACQTSRWSDFARYFKFTRFTYIYIYFNVVVSLNYLWSMTRKKKVSFRVYVYLQKQVVEKHTILVLFFFFFSYPLRLVILELKLRVKRQHGYTLRRV